MTTNSYSGQGLLEFMSCEKLDTDLYVGQSKDLNTGQVYGGQVLGQAIKAATSTVDQERSIRSAHAYFVRKGNVSEPIIYHVDRTLDGGSVSSRVVIATQNDQQILHLSSSYHKPEDGLDFCPEVEVPVEALEKAIAIQGLSTQHYQIDFLDILFLEDTDKTDKSALQFWIKTKEKLPIQASIHQSVLAYISDTGLLHSALIPSGLDQVSKSERNIILASIDHAIWFHRPFRADEWFFYDCRAVSTSGARGLAQGRLYDRAGRLFASTMQEGLLRFKR